MSLIAEHVRLLFLRKKSTLCELIRPCALIFLQKIYSLLTHFGYFSSHSCAIMSIFDNIFNSVRLLGPVRLLVSNIFPPCVLIRPCSAIRDTRVRWKLVFFCHVFCHVFCFFVMFPLLFLVFLQEKQNFLLIYHAQ